MLENRARDYISAQVSVMGEIDLSAANFQMDRGFLIKNDGDEQVTLEVTLLSMPEDSFVETKFDPGWNPELVRVIKQNNASLNLKYGY